VKPAIPALFLVAACTSSPAAPTDAPAADAVIHYDGTDDHDAPHCNAGPEDTLAACTDGCDNDGNGYADEADFGCCGIVPNAACAPARDSCPGVDETWVAAPLTGGHTYHVTASAVATFAGTSTIYQCNPSLLTTSTLDSPPGERQVVFHLAIPMSAPARTTLQLQVPDAGNVRGWEMGAGCGAGESCVVPQAFGTVGTVIGSLTPGAELYYVVECDDSSSAQITLALDLTNQ
jgi:hypothetical protein